MFTRPTLYEALQRLFPEVLTTSQWTTCNLAMSASAEPRGITPQVFAAWGRTQSSTVNACPTQQPVVFDSRVAHRAQRFEFDTAVVRQSVLMSSIQQFVDRICWLIPVETVCFLRYHDPEVTLCG